MSSAGKHAVSPDAPAQIWTGRVFSADLSRFRSHFGSRSFALRHNLAGHPLFEPARLALAAERAIASGRADRFAVAGDGASPGSRFREMGERPRIAQAIADLRVANSWMKLSTIHDYDPDYADLLRDALADVREMSGKLAPGDVSYAQLTVFLASPNVVTPFHIDHEYNLFSQITGRKKVVCVFPPDNRELLRLSDIEAFYTGNPDAARYKPELQSLGAEYAMEPGMTIHHPPLAPHWVRNGDDVSISLSLNLCMPPIDRRARVHQVNFYLRKLGFDPTEPRPGFPDSLKASLVGVFSKRHPESYQDVVFSGLERVRRPYDLARNAWRRARGLPPLH